MLENKNISFLDTGEIAAETYTPAITVLDKTTAALNIVK